VADPLPKQVEDLSTCITNAKTELKRSASYYDATHRLETIGISTPPEMRKLTAAVGWPRMYLDAIEERLDIEDFRLSGKAEADEELREWWQSNDMDEESGLCHLDAMIYGRSYVTVAAPDEEAGDDPKIPLIRVESPLHFYAETDPRTRRITRALRLYEKHNHPEEAWATLYLPDQTISLVRDLNTNGQWRPDGIVQHDLGQVPVVALHNRERLADRDGRSEITPELRTFTDAAARTVMNMQSAAELMALPQRVLFGVDAESIAGSGSSREILDAYMARIIAIENEMGKAFQFSAADLRNFVEVLEELAKHVASYTGLPPQYLTFSSDNPASAEAIKSSESRLVKKCERKARMFGGSWERVMRLAKLIMDGSVPEEWRRLETVWRDPSTPTYAAKADAAAKLYANGNGIIPLEQARIDMGYSAEQREQMKEWDDEAPQAQLSTMLGAAFPRPGQPPAPGQPADPRAGQNPNPRRPAA
jgi:hypothetical protein